MLGRWSLPVTAVCVLLALSGCTEDPEPKFADPSSAPDSATPSTEPTSPEPTSTTSGAAEALSPEKTVRTWVAAFNNASLTGRVDDLRALSADDCLQCNQVAEGLRSIYEAGGSIEGGAWRIQKLKRQGDFEESKTLGVLITSEKATTIERQGGEPIEDPEMDLVMTWTLREQPAGWIVAELAILS